MFRIWQKEPTKSELKNKEIARRSVFIKKSVEKGELITEDLIIALRPGDGISPMKIPEIIGMRFKKSLPSYTMINEDDII